MSLDSVYLRCFVDRREEDGFEPEYEYKFEPRPNDTIHLVLYTHATHDEFANLVIGACGIWVNSRLFQLYVFYADDTPESEIAKLRKSCSQYRVIVLSRIEFVEKVFFPFVHKARAKCIGFELPHTISRLATQYTEGRLYKDGFSFTLSDRPKFPAVVIKSITSKSQFIGFTKAFRSKKKSNIPYHRGGFVDCKTLGFVLTNNSYSLDTALSDFECPIKPIKSKKQGIISDQNIKSCINGIFAIYSLYRQQMKRYHMFCLKTLESKLFSPASLGKDDLSRIGIRSFFDQNPDFPKEILGYLMSAYHGGRVDAIIVNKPTLITNLDFTSTYPTLFALFGMYLLLIAEKISYHTTTQETQEFLNRTTISDVNKPETWKKMLTICKIIPDDDILPIRSDYGNKVTTNTGTNYLKSVDGTGLWFTLPDLLASKLLTGKTPKIIEAITFVPQGVQSGLRDIEITKGITLQQGEDLFKKLVEQRFAINDQIKNADDETKKQLEQTQKILKIVANSSAYGIFIQLNTSTTMLSHKVTMHGLESFDTQTTYIENPAPFFNPIISVFLTAGARLILAAVEHLLEQNNGYMVYCDTDAVFVSPQHADLIQEFFVPLNPYSTDVKLFKIQEENGKKLENVTCLAISAKRYALYNYDNRKIQLYKYSNHALGHLKGIDQEQFWQDIILLHHNPQKEDQVKSKYETKCAVSELTITSYPLLRTFDGVNDEKPYSQQIKPYNTILVGIACRKDQKTGTQIVPVVPKIDENYDEVPFRPFVDKSGKSYPNSESFDTTQYWEKMSEYFTRYREHREAKLDGFEGVLKRRHLVFGKQSVKYVGKEINELEASTVFGVSKDDSIIYENQDEKIRRFIENLTEEKARQIGIPRRTFFDWKKKLREGKPIKLKTFLLEKIFNV